MSVKRLKWYYQCHRPSSRTNVQWPANLINIRMPTNTNNNDENTKPRPPHTYLDSYGIVQTNTSCIAHSTAPKRAQHLRCWRWHIVHHVGLVYIVARTIAVLYLKQQKILIDTSSSLYTITMYIVIKSHLCQCGMESSFTRYIIRPSISARGLADCAIWRTESVHRHLGRVRLTAN